MTHTPTPAAKASNGLASAPRQALLPFHTQRKAQRLAARVEVFSDVVRGAQEQGQAAQLALNELVAEALDEAGVETNPTDRFNINWKTGVVTLLEEGSP